MSDKQVTHDRFLGGAVTVVQAATGYRAGLDAVLLAASLSAQDGESLAEAGSGAGAALLCAAHRLSSCHFTGFERDADALALARQGVIANGFQARADIVGHDVAERHLALENVYDQSFANPPFFDPGSVRAPAAGKQASHLALTPLKAWILFLHHITRPGGRLTLIHRAAAIGEVLELMSPRTGEIEIMPVRPRPGAEAVRILVRARKGLRRGPVRLYDGLSLEDVPGTGVHSSRAAACFEGYALDWR